MQSPRILILESQPINAKLIRYYLHRATDCRVAATVSSLEQAKEEVKRLKVNIIIIDMFRVSNASLALLDWLSSSQLNIKVLAFLRLSEERNIIETIRRRVNAVLYEDASLNEIKDVIEQLAQQNTANQIGISNPPIELSKEALQAGKVANKLALLTSREKEILKLVLDGCSNNEIAQEMEISVRTVENHRANIIRKTDGKNFFYLAKIICKNALLDIY